MNFRQHVCNRCLNLVVYGDKYSIVGHWTKSLVSFSNFHSDDL